MPPITNLQDLHAEALKQAPGHNIEIVETLPITAPHPGKEKDGKPKPDQILVKHHIKLVVDDADRTGNPDKKVISILRKWCAQNVQLEKKIHEAPTLSVAAANQHGAKRKERS